MRWSTLGAGARCACGQGALPGSRPRLWLGLRGSHRAPRRNAAARWTLLGNDPSVVAKVKAPETFFAELARLGIAHPATVSKRPRRDRGLARKAPRRRRRQPRGPRGPADSGSRGQVRFTSRDKSTAVRCRRCSSATAARRACSASASNGRRRRLRSKWRYGGALCPADLSPESERLMTEATERAAAAFQLTGLGSADFLVGDERGRCSSRSIRGRAPPSTFSTAKTCPCSVCISTPCCRESFRTARLCLTPPGPRPLSTPRKPSKSHQRCPGRTGPPISRKAENGSTKTARYALCGPALRLKSKQDAWSRSELPGF